MLGVFAGAMAVLCVVELAYIWYLRGGLVHIPNDHYDNMFGEAQHSIDRNSPEIWDQEHQDFIHNAVPVSVHAHNDYLHRIPLFEALGSGCISVEADIHLSEAALLVAHTDVGLRGEKTLRSMYLDPLRRIIGAQNDFAPLSGDDWKGIYNKSPKQTIVLLVDHKTAGAETFEELDRQLQPLRDLDYLTYWNSTARIMRPLTIVASGEAPFESILNMTDFHRDIFWDAKLERLSSTQDNFDVEPPIFRYNISNSYFASTRWQNARLWRTELDPSEPEPPASPALQDLYAGDIEQAEARGLISRYWDTPASPPNVQEIAWRVQLEQKVGILNMDDLAVVRARATGWGLGRSSELR